MIKSELVQRIASQNPHLYQRDVENIINAILGEVTAAMARGDRVELRGFGAFSVKNRPARTCRSSGNPCRSSRPARKCVSGSIARSLDVFVFQEMRDARKPGRQPAVTRFSRHIWCSMINGRP